MPSEVPLVACRGRDLPGVGRCFCSAFPGVFPQFGTHLRSSGGPRCREYGKALSPHVPRCSHRFHLRHVSIPILYCCALVILSAGFLHKTSLGMNHVPSFGKHHEVEGGSCDSGKEMTPDLHASHDSQAGSPFE